MKYDVDFTRTDQHKVTKIKNLAHVESGNHKDDHPNEVEVPVEPSIEKEGGYDSTSNTFWWRIKLNNGNGEDVSGWTVKDAVIGKHKIVGNVTIFRIENWQSIRVKDIEAFNGQSGFSIKLSDYIEGLSDDQKKEDFWIEYRTEAPAGNPGETVSETNYASYQPEQGTGSSTSTTVNGTLRDWHVQKDFKSWETTQLNAKETEIVSKLWHSEVTIGAGNLTEFTYTDEIGQVLDGQGNDQHYATAKDLEDYFIKDESTSKNRKTGLYLKLGEYDRYNYNGAGEATTRSYYYGADEKQSDVTIKVTYFDAERNEVSPTDKSTHVKSFIVTVTPAEGKTINARALVLKEYRTMVDTTTQKAGQTWTIKNTGKVKDKTSEAQDEHTRPHKFVKEVYTGKTNENAPVYKAGDQKVPYKWDSSYLADKIQLDKGQLLYRLMLHTSQSEDGKDITITDTLPAGMTLVEGSVYAKFYQGTWEADSNNDWSHNTNFQGANKPFYTTVKNDDGTTTLTITIPNYKYSSGSPDVAVYYKVSVAEDPAWNDPDKLTKEDDPSKLVKEYKNLASWNRQTSSDNVKVERNKTYIDKSGVQLYEDGNPTGKIRYTIVINSAADDLDPKANTLTLVDTMENKFNPQLDLSSVKLFNYDSTKEKNIGTELISTSYEMVYDTTNHKMTLTVPDSKAMILVYDYSIDENYHGTPTITNKADLLNEKWTSEDSAKLVEIKSSATAKHNQIIIYKVDSSNYRNTLAGAEFTLESYAYDSSTQQGTWTQVGKTLTTDDKGEITFNLSDKQLTVNTLYRLIETEAPDGYGLDATPHYFIWKADSVSDNDAYNKANEHGTGGVDRSKITFISNGGGKMYIPNEYTRIGVIKSWAKPDGSKYTPPEGTKVKVKLYQQTLAPVDYCKVRATVINEISQQTQGDPIYIKRGSSITIMSQANNHKGTPATITYGTTSASVPMTLYNYNQHYKYTIENVTTDLTDIVITAKDGWPGKPFYLDYESPDEALSSRHEIQQAELSKDNDWSCSWDNLPKTDNEGHPYYYTVEETAVTQNGKDISSQYTTTYSNNNGIQSGQMVITNTAKKDEITLPSTGGMGTWIFRALGIISIGIGIEILLFIKRKIEIGGKGL